MRSGVSIILLLCTNGIYKELVVEVRYLAKRAHIASVSMKCIPTTKRTRTFFANWPHTVIY